MKKLFLAVLILSVLVSCKDEKFSGDNNEIGTGFKQKGNDGGAKPRRVAPADAYDGENENGFKNVPYDPLGNANSDATCLWCGNVIDATIKSRIIINPGDPLKILPSARFNPEFTNAQFCGLRCFNDFKKTHLNNVKTEIAYNDSTKIYSILISK